MPCNWGGNSRSGITLDMQHRLVVYPSTSLLPQGNEHTAYTRHGVWHTLPWHKNINMNSTKTFTIIYQESKALKYDKQAPLVSNEQFSLIRFVRWLFMDFGQFSPLTAVKISSYFQVSTQEVIRHRVSNGSIKEWCKIEWFKIITTKQAAPSAIANPVMAKTAFLNS